LSLTCGGAKGFSVNVDRIARVGNSLQVTTRRVSEGHSRLSLADAAGFEAN